MYLCIPVLHIYLSVSVRSVCEYVSVCWTVGFCVRVYTFVNT